MLLIVFHHFANLYFNYYTINISRLWYNLIAIGWNLWVDIFVLITWYFLIDSKKISLKKILILYGEIFFYSIIALIIFSIFWEYKINMIDFIKSVLPIRWNNYWFASCYFILYLIHPILNKFLTSLNKDIYVYLIAILILLFSILPTFVPLIWVWWWPLLIFIILYAIAWYIKLYKPPILNNRKWLLRAILILIISYSTTVIFSLIWIYIPKINNYIFYFYWKDTITIVLLSITLFLFFLNNNLKYNKYINLIASCTFWIYLIHDNIFIRHWLWVDVFKNSNYQDTIYLIPYSIFVCIFVFFVCVLIDLIRKKIIEKYYLKLIDIINPLIQKIENNLNNRINKL